MEVFSENEDDTQKNRWKKDKKKCFRKSVSSEIFGINSIKKSYIPRVIPKNKEPIAHIRDRYMNS